jgi:hypothetical protein
MAMRRAALFLSFVCCVWSESGANPILDPYYEAGITEAYVPGPAEWYFELDGQWCLFNFKTQTPPRPENFPCSSDVYLRIQPVSAAGVTYRARVRFGENKLGVLNQASLQLTQQQRAQGFTVRVNSDDTIKITMDTSKEAATASRNGVVPYWSFPLRPVTAGNSLIAVRDYSYKIKIYSTCRRSIGSPGDYSTKYKFTLLDNYGIPFRNISVKRGSQYIATTDAAGACSVSVPIITSDSSVLFCDRCALHQFDEVDISTQPIHYSDADTLVKKNVKITATQYLLTVENPVPALQLLCFKGDSNRYVQANFWAGGPSSTMVFRIYPSLPVYSLCFAPNNPYSTGCYASWSGAYVDTAVIIRDTIAVKMTAVSRAHRVPAVSSGITLSVFCENRRAVHAVISSPLSSARTSLSLYALSGKEIGNIPVDMHGSGTSTALFRFSGRELSPGAYFCRLTVEGYSPVARQITIP